MLMETELPLQYIKGEKNRNMAFFGMIQFKWSKLFKNQIASVKNWKKDALVNVE
jgi:hypothetical protein